MKGWWLLFPPQFPTSLLSKKPDPGISVQILASSARCKFWHHPLELKRVLIGYGERELGLDQVSFTNAIYQCHVWEKRWCQLPVFVEVWNNTWEDLAYTYTLGKDDTHTILKWASLCMVFKSFVLFALPRRVLNIALNIVFENYPPLCPHWICK